MSKRKLISLVLAFMLVITLVTAMISCNRRDEDVDQPSEKVTSEKVEKPTDENTGASSCRHEYDNACDAECNLCGEQKRPAPHVEEVIPGTPATCTQTGLTEGTKCSVCGKVLKEQEEIPVIDHLYDNACDVDCNECGATREVGAHVYDNACDTSCNVCGAERAVDDHVYDNACDVDCNVCGEVREVEGHTEEAIPAVDATCTETGLTAGVKCSVCGEILVAQETVDALGHTEVVDAAVAPTCTETGLTEGKHCSVCNEVLVAQTVVNALGHTEVIDVAVAPTCTEAGLTEGKHCSVCGEVFVAQEEVAALGHTEVVDAAVAPTCTEAGLTEGKHCSVCGEVLVAQEEVAALGHTEVVDAAVAPTCTEAGLTEGKHCSVCGEVLVAQNEVAAFGHTYDNNCDAECNVCHEIRTPYDHANEVIPGQDATCTETGLTEGLQCSVCGEITLERHPIAALGHDYYNDCDVDCNRCGEVREVADHVYDNSCDIDCNVCGAERTPEAHQTVQVAGKAPTCIETGLEDAYRCTVCGQMFDAEGNKIDEQVVIPATGHVYDSDTDATCNVCGDVRDVACEHVYDNPCDADCNVCGTTRAIEHDIENIEGTEATCTQTGLTYGQKCKNCDYVKKEQTEIPAKGHRYSFDAACDAECNVCGAVREDVAEHTVQNIDGLAPTCTTSGYTSSSKCEACGEVLVASEYIPATGHAYDNACDAACNGCDFFRTGAEHIYDNACDVDCNECGFTRPANHTYANECATVCDVCGAVREGGHLFDGPCDADCNRGCGFTRDASEHEYEYDCSKTCLFCGQEREADHIYDNACDSACNACGTLNPDAKHSFSAEWTKGETAHWQECSVCGAKQLKAAHIYTTACDADCNECGAIRTPADHIYDNGCDEQCNTCYENRTVGAHSNTTAYDETAHWNVCQECGAVSGRGAHDYNDGICSCGRKADPCSHSYQYACSTICGICQEVREPVADHNYELKSDEFNHWYECSACFATKNSQVHTFVVTADDARTHSNTCVVCGYESGEAAPHAFIDGICSCGYESACAHTGGEAKCNKLAVCDICGCEYGEYAPHTENIVSSEVPASCTSDGVTAAIQCSVCEKWIQEPKPIPAFGHTIVETAGKAPTCTETGLTVGKACKTCGHTEASQEIIPVLEHTYQQTGYNAPTCESNGSVIYSCVYCGASKEDIVLTTGHQASSWIVTVAPTCTSDGTQIQRCVNCGEEVGNETITSLGHIWDSGVVTEPTCTAGGYTTKTCTVCKAITQEDPTVPFNHSWQDVIDRKATCTVDGSMHQECSTCGAWGNVSTIFASGQHTWSETLTYNANGHWQTCQNCEATNTVESHNVQGDGVCDCGYECVHTGGNANCTVKATCTICGCEYGDFGAHVPGASATCSDAQLCAICSTEIAPAKGHTPKTDAAVAPSCTGVGLTEGSHCEDCGEIILAQEKVPAAGHSYVENVCTVCGEIKPSGEVCEHVYDDCVDATCNICNEERTAPGHVEVYVAGEAATCTTAGKTLGKKCVACEAVTLEQTEIPALGHTSTRWVIDRVATCTVDGYKYEICNICGEMTGNEETTPKADHDYIVVDVASTCQTAGYTTETCKYCNASKDLVQKELAAHTPGDWKVSFGADCNQAGEEYQVCAVCGLETGETREIAKLAHNEIAVVTAPTCDADGYTTYTCTLCNAARTEINTGSATGHVSGGWVVDVQASCETYGSKSEICAVCGNRTGNTQTIDALGHNYVGEVNVEPSCEYAGEGIYRCTVCGAVDEENSFVIAPLAHTAGSWIVDVEAGCESEGRRYIECTVCFALIEEQTISATGHNYIVRVEGNKVVTTCTGCGYYSSEDYVAGEHTHTLGGYRIETNATCAAPGVKYAVCATCGADMGEAIEIPELGHEYYVVVVAPTCRAQGYTTKTCTRCSDTSTEYTDPVACVSGGWVIDSAAGCDYAGSKHEVCINCGSQIGESVEIPETGHSYVKTVVAPTCDEAGYTAYECACGAYYEGDSVEATGHVSGGWFVQTPATCTSTGIKKQICSICQEPMGEEVIPATEHDLAIIVVLPTCTEQGYTLKACKACGTSERVDYVNANGHTESEWITDTQATCDAEGTKYTVCTVCGNRVSVGSIDATDHTYTEMVVNPTCSATGAGTNGYTLHYCINCGTSYTDNEVEPTHTYAPDDDTTCIVCGFWRDTAAECEHAYSSACDATCNICGAVREASAHVEETIAGKDATCLETGLTEGKKCSVCGTVTVVQKTLPKTAHTYDNDCDATCNVCTATRVTADHKYDNGCDVDCNVCGAVRIPEAHKYDSDCDADCNVCGVTRVTSGHVYSNACDATCNECGATRTVGDHVYDNCYDTECNECGKKRAETHNYGNDNICDDCGYELTCDHAYTDCTDETCNKCGSTRTAPGHSGGTATCTRKATCDVCGKAYGDTVPHTPNIPAATCTDNQVCTVCNRTITQKLGHNYVAVVTEATCTEQGFTTNTCSNCGDSYISNYVAALGHSIVDVAGKAATCTETGLTTGKKCSRCGLVTVSQTEIAKLPHSYGNDNFCDNCGFEKIECPHDWAGTCNTECGICGEIRTVTHDYDTSKYEYTENTHWYECTICGAKNSETSHAYDNTCDTTCNSCDYTRTTTHRFSSSWTKDASGHWHVCSVCKATTTTESHNYDNVCDTTCSVCNYRRTVEHAYSSNYSTDGTYHWYACTTSGCTATTTKTVHDFDNTCDTNCGTCGYTRTTTHQYSSTWTKGDNGHWHVCSVCGETDTLKAHVWDNGCDTACNTCGYTRATSHVYDNATCDTTCNVCGATRSVSHNYSTFWSQDGSNHWYTCLTCGAIKGKTAHVYVNSCDADCNTCGYVRNTDHTWGDTWQKNASGHYKVCSKCNAQSAVSGHGYDNNCDTTCNTCGYSRSISHKYATTYSYDSTYHYFACEVCGAKQLEIKHLFSNDCDTTCNTTGCGYERTTSHSYSNTWTKDTNAHWHQCTSCGEVADYSEHAYVNECDTKCDTCGQTRTITHTYDNNCDTTCNICGATRSISHTYYSTYESDSSKHWQSCSVCGARRNESTHVYDGSDDTECNTCGYNRSVSHNWSNSYTSDGTHHWYKCTDAGCSAITGKTTHKYSNNCDPTCNDCGYERSVTHTFGTAWQKDASGHWHVCAICQTAGSSTAHQYDNGCDTNCNECGYQRDAAHNYDNACDSDCNTCGKTRTVPHNYGDFYYTNDNQHWYQCADCGVTKGAANHTYTNNCDAYCNVCNKQREVEHNYSTLWTKDSTDHWHVCTICGVKTDIQKHQYANACDTTCDDCGQTRTVGDHQWASTYNSNASYHWYRCTSCGAEKDKGVHKFDSVCDAECNTCGYTRAGTSHEYSTSLTNDSTSHWYACTKCGAKNNEVKHVYDNACDTTCNTQGCGYIRSANHSYATTYSSNGTHHWQACGVCGIERNKASHAFSNTCDPTCDTCGYTRTTQHSYSVTYSSDANQHWYACIICGAKNNSADHVWANDCDTNCNTCGYTRKTTHKYDNNCDTTCNVCGASRSISHAYASTWSKDDTYHWYECSVCHAKKSMATHNYSSGTDTTCDSCNYTRDLAACQHTYDNPCGDKTCNKCGETRTNMADHTYDNGCDTTCNICGQVARTATHTYDHGCDPDCNICGATRTTSHSYSSNYSTDANNHWKECVACGAVQGTPVAHGYSSSCDETCNTCGYTRVTEHTWDTSGYTTDANYHWYKCTVCGAQKDRNAHNFTNACDTSCGECGYVRKITHSYGSSYEVDSNNHWYQCTVCGNKTGTGAHVFKLTSISNTQHTKACTTCKYVASTDSHIFNENNKCECGAEKVIVETYATSVDYINLNGPYSNFGSNSVDGIQSIKGYGTDFYGKLSIRGWCVTDSGITGYYYNVNGGAWKAISATGLTAASSAHISAASGKAGVSTDAPTANCVFGTPLTVDLSGYWGQTLDVTFAAATVSGTYVTIITLEDVTVWNPEANGRPVVQFDLDKGVANGYAIDGLKVNGGYWTINVNSMEGIAEGLYARNHTSISIKSGEYITLTGWMGYKNQGINAFGYFFANQPANVTLSSSFVGTPESAVLQPNNGGQYAKRFVIDIDTNSLSDGVHRVYFVAQLADGTITIIQYLDILVEGKDDDYVVGSDVADSQVQVAQKDQTTSFSTAPASKSGNTYTMYAGLKFTTSASYNSGTYRFTVPSSGITLSFPDGQFSEFNRFKFQYASANAAKVVMAYVDSAGNILQDTLYLEPGQGTFTCLVQEYINGGTAKDINSITIYPLGTSSTQFMLAHVSTEMYEWYLDDMTYIQNARFKVGTRLAWGGALCYFEDKNDGISSIRNLINVYDEGRLIQQSWYNSGVLTGNYNGTKWKYNPVQGGDWIGNDSRIIDVVVEDFSMYIKAQPMDWGAGANGDTATITPSYMENWYTVYSDRVRVDNRFFDYSGYTATGVCNQEVPAMYFIGYLNSFAYDGSSGDWNSCNYTYKTNLPFWSGGSGSDNVYDPNYAITTRFAVSGSETWGAWYNSGTGFGMGFYIPGIKRFISGRNQYNMWGDTTSAFTPGCAYTAAGADANLQSFRAYNYSYLLTTGTVQNIRNTFSKYRGFVTNVLT